MKLRQDLHHLLVNWLESRPILYPRRVRFRFPDGFEPTHLDCYGTARKVHEVYGFEVLAGVKFLDKNGKLFPWPHMVNVEGDTLDQGVVDASPKPDQRDLGFVPIGAGETEFWNQITDAYATVSDCEALGASWGCSLADDLTDRYFENLKRKACFWDRTLADIVVPATIPKATVSS